MDCVVLKFGGTSVQDAAAVRRLVGVVAAEPRRRVVVVSALAGVTDTLADVASGATRSAAAGETLHRLLERHLEPLLARGCVPVVGGFVGVTRNGATTTLVVGLAHQIGVTVADVRARGVTGSPRFLQTALDALALDGQRVNVVALSPSRLESGHALVCVTTRELASRVLSQLHEMFFEPVHA